VQASGHRTEDPALPGMTGHRSSEVSSRASQLKASASGLTAIRTFP
jgi:hypothetical protein